MTKCKEALIALRDKVRDGEWKQIDAFGASTNDARERFVSAFNLHDAHNAWAAYHGSLNAALALCEAVLPGWGWTIDADGAAQVWRRGPVIGFHSALNDTPARALLLAILEAKIAEEE